MNTKRQIGRERGGRLRATARGSVLILVVGVLALIATVVIVYTTVGQADKRGGAGAVRQARSGEAVEAVADHLANLVARGTFKHVVQEDLFSRPTAVRAPMDYPGVDPYAVSFTSREAVDLFGTVPSQSVQFAPDGSVGRWTFGTVDPRGPRDPWLASSTAEDLLNVAVDANAPWRTMRDWRALSVAAPGGLFVNLANLRNNFQAESGVGEAADRRPRLSTGLTLLKPDYQASATSARAPERIPPATLELPDALPLPYVKADGSLATLTRVPDLRRTADSAVDKLYRPAMFALNQLGMAHGLRETRDSSARISAWARLYDAQAPDRLVPGDQEYFANQYADADGDGWADSRWFEMADPTPRDRDGKSVARGLTPGGEDGVRYFVAARIVDLSGKVNVNTAMQFGAAPTASRPAGFTPADVDLERLFMAADAGAFPGSVAFTQSSPAFYALLSQPAITFSSSDTRDPGNYLTENGYGVGASGAAGPDYREAVGRSAFAALLDARLVPAAQGDSTNSKPSRDGYYPPDDASTGALNAPGWARETALDSGATLFSNSVVSAEDRARLFRAGGTLEARASLAPDNPANADLRLRGRTAAFGPGDELELRTFEGVNDARVTSALERTLAGRHAAAANLSPLRSNRSLALERLDRDRVQNQNFPQSVNLRSDDLEDPDTALQAQVDLRRLLTTVSGGRYLAASTLRLEETGGTATDAQFAAVRERAGRLGTGDVPLQVDEVLARLNAASLAATASEVSPNWAAMGGAANDLFRAAADALLPYSGETTGGNRSGSSLWDAESDALSPSNPARTLAYGGYRTSTENYPSGTVPAPQASDYRGSTGETAIRIAAHWTANLIASRLQWTNPIPASRSIGALGVEAADLPVVFTLLSAPEDQVPGGGGTARQFLDSGAYSTGAGGAVQASLFPEWNVRDAFTTLPPNQRGLAPRVAGRLDLGDARLAPRPAGGGPERWSPATRIFGITPQPFLTQVAAVRVYVSDERTNAATNQTEVFFEFTNGTGGRGKSYIGEFVAFALHNPFDVELSLTKVKTRTAPDQPARIVNADDGESTQLGEVRQYIEFGGRRYALGDSNFTSPNTSSLGNILLAPGETKVVFISDRSLPQVEQALRDAGATVPSQTAVQEWLMNLLAGRRDAPAIRLLPFADEAMTSLQPPSGVFAASDPAANRVAKLWKIVRTGDEQSSNNRWNDILVDRIFDPAAAGSSETLRPVASPNGETIVLGATEKGQVLVLGGRFRRPNAGSSLGGFPAYCLEVKRPALTGGLDARATGVGSLNIDWKTPPSITTHIGGGDTLSSSVFGSTSGGYTGDLLSPSITALLAPTSTAPNSTDWDIGRKPGTYAPGPFPSTRNLSGLPWQAASQRTAIAGVETGVAYAWTGEIELPVLLPPLRTRGSLATRDSDAVLGSAATVAPLYDSGGAAIDARPIAPPLRASDLINTLAIGPSHDPLRTRQAGGSQYEDAANEEVQWTTLAEAMALALDYDSPAQPSPGSSEPIDPMYRVGGVDPRWFPLQTSATPPSGTVVLGALVKGRLALDRFVPFIDRSRLDGSGGPDGIFNPAEDRVRGLGLPLALNLLDRVRVGPTGSLTRKVPGTVNVNTAPQAVLAALPMAAPSLRAGDWPTSAQQAGNRLVSPDHEVWDVTGTLLGYRDKRVGFALARQRTGATDPIASDFTDFNALANELYPAPPGFSATDPLTWRARSINSGVLGLREALGFATPGEWLLARLRWINESGFADPSEQRRQVSVDRQSRGNVRAREIRQPGAGSQETIVYGVNAGLYFNALPASANDTTTRTFASALLRDAPSAAQPILDALAGSANTRSDVFCAWFLVHGYRASDVEGLAPSDPMVPSFAKRYVMVVDRSNVVAAGDRPKILLFQEVPVRPDR